MTKKTTSRRAFLKSSVPVFGASWVALHMPQVLLAAESANQNKLAGTGYENISAQEAVEFGAVVDQIIPRDETPGATDMGVVYYIDAALGGFMAAVVPVLRQGLEDLQLKTQAAHPPNALFSELTFEQQTELLRSVENTPFFGIIHFQTLCGMFALPKYGGNRENAGWDLIGFDHQHAWQPPFGYYDRAAHAQVND